MNKTVSINLGGLFFNIEEHAYQLLYNYLQSIKNNFSEEAERDEIMSDIELRIAEIFQSTLSAAKEVILEKDVQEMMNIMGRPEDYVQDEFADSKSQNDSTNQQQNFTTSNQKRLYRDTENVVLGGVCSGLGHYVGVDATIIRIIFVLLAILGGSGVIIYLVLLFVIPEARTTTERMQMRGEPINIESIKENFNRIKTNIQENSRNGKFKKTFNETVNRGAQAGSNAFKVIGKVLGALFILGGTFGLILMFTLLFSDSGFFPLTESEHIESLNTFLGLIYPGNLQATFVFIAILIVTLIPIFAIIYTGTKLLFNIKQSFRMVSITSGIIWLIGVAILVITGINLGMNMRAENSLENSIEVSDSIQTLHVEVLPDDIFSNHLSYNEIWNQSELIKVENERIYYGYPELILSEKKDSGNFSITIIKESNGKSNKEAVEKAERITYQPKYSNGNLFLPAYFSVPESDKLRNQMIKIEIEIPFGKQLVLGKSINRIEVDIDDHHNHQENYSNTNWHADKEGMKCKNCKELNIEFE